MRKSRGRTRLVTRWRLPFRLYASKLPAARLKFPHRAQAKLKQPAAHLSVVFSSLTSKRLLQSLQTYWTSSGFTFHNPVARCGSGCGSLSRGGSSVARRGRAKGALRRLHWPVSHLRGPPWTLPGARSAWRFCPFQQGVCGAGAVRSQHSVL